MSTHFDKFIVGVLMVLQMGLPGSGCISLCILGRKYMFPPFGESTNIRFARSSYIFYLPFHHSSLGGMRLSIS